MFKRNKKEEFTKLLFPFLNIRNYKLKNLWYIIVAKYKKFIKREYNRVWGEDEIDEMLFKVSQCPKCYLNGACIKCGCDFKELITTNKKCPDGRF